MPRREQLAQNIKGKAFNLSMSLSVGIVRTHQNKNCICVLYIWKHYFVLKYPISARTNLAENYRVQLYNCFAHVHPAGVVG